MLIAHSLIAWRSKPYPNAPYLDYFNLPRSCLISIENEEGAGEEGAGARLAMNNQQLLSRYNNSYTQASTDSNLLSFVKNCTYYHIAKLSL